MYCKFLLRNVLLLLTIICYVHTFGQVDTTQKIVLDRRNQTSQEQKPYVILISIDGFRYDYIKRYHATHLQNLAETGITAKAMYPSFPSITFPNHYSIVTGLYPSHHGLIGNDIYDEKTGERYSIKNKAVKDPKWYGGTPLWVLAEKQQMLAASFYWPGSEAPIQNTLPTYYYAYNEIIPIGRRIQTVKDWLSLPSEKRPHFITFYFPEVDHAGHKYGPESIQTEEAVHYVDSAINELTKAVAATNLPVNFIIVSDHGMIHLDESHPIRLPFTVNPKTEAINSNGSIVDIFVKDSLRKKELYHLLTHGSYHFKAYYKSEVPSKYHYNATDDRHDRIGDIVLMANAPFYFSNNEKTITGSHGFFVGDTPEMKATFLAWGPAFQSGKTIKAFSNIEVYPLIATILGLKFNYTDIDSKGILIKETLK